MSNKELHWTEHLEELRRRIIFVVIFLAIFFVVGLFIHRPLIHLLTWPLEGLSTSLYFTSPEEGFMVTLKVALFFGLFATFPFILWQLWAFVRPGLEEKEGVGIFVVFLAATALFLFGSLFCYFLVLPTALKFLLSFTAAEFKPLLSVGKYSSFVGFMILAFGISFNLPLLVIGLAQVGIVTAAWLRHQRKIVILGIFIIAAILTPSPDVISQLMLATPLLVLFEITILITAWMEKRKTLRLFTETS
ncbi:MAG: twin-arginine translocase subunit TatC [Candidatus Omnitrophica bacterium]|nr:twin-arginine translocase subunit TatC [Candidatus Omnitrophota bacterium]